MVIYSLSFSIIRDDIANSVNYIFLSYNSQKDIHYGNEEKKYEKKNKYLHYNDDKIIPLTFKIAHSDIYQIQFDLKGFNSFHENRFYFSTGICWKHIFHFSQIAYEFSDICIQEFQSHSIRRGEQTFIETFTLF